METSEYSQIGNTVFIDVANVANSQKSTLQPRIKWACTAIRRYCHRIANWQRQLYIGAWQKRYCNQNCASGRTKKPSSENSPSGGQFLFLDAKFAGF
jgi:hypothetical protein